MLIFGIDGASWQVLDQAIDHGCMPYLAGLIKTGQRGILKSTNPPLTPAAWASFHMSKNPGHHGVVDFVSWNKDLLIPELVDSGNIGETVWQRLEQKQLKTSLINVPMTYPVKHLATNVVSGILTPDKDSQWSYPKDLKFKILQDLPNYQPISLSHSSVAEIEVDIPGFLEFVASRIQMRKNLALWFVKNKHQNILMTQFQVIDWVQHALWYALDPNHSLFKKSLQSIIFKKVYQQVDLAMEEIAQAWEKELKTQSQIIVVSDHGFQSHFKRILLGNYLYDQGFLDKRAGVKSKLNNFLPHNNLTKNLSPIELLGRSQWGFGYLNQGFDLNITFSKLKKLCDQLTDPDTGKKVIKKIHLASDLFAGPKMDLLPEILIEPVDGYSVTSAIDKSGRYFEPVVRGQDFHMGIHHIDGVIATNFSAKLPTEISDFGNWLERIV